MPINSPSTLDTNLTAGGTNAQGLSEWAAPYVTDYLGKAKALSETPYEAYKGPLTAGSSNIQNKLFSGIESLDFPSQLGKSFSSTGAYQLPQYDASGPMGSQQPMMLNQGSNGSGDFGSTPQNVASQYMNPYLQSVLTPQLEELRRQSLITQNQNAGKMANAGAFGGSRQAIMDAENQRNLMQEQNKTVGQGYANAYDKAMGQFNTEQGQAKTLADLMASTGATQRGIESEGVAADLGEFEKQRQFPYQQLTFQRDMMAGLPTSSVSNTPAQMSDIGNLLSVLGGGTKVAEALGYKDVGSLLKKLGLDIGP
jgi:hypothetical protein